MRLNPHSWWYAPLLIVCGALLIAAIMWLLNAIGAVPFWSTPAQAGHSVARGEP